MHISSISLFRSSGRFGRKTLVGLALATTASLLMSGVASALPAQGTPAPVTVSLPIDTLDTTIPIATVLLKAVVTTNIDASLNYVGFQGDFTFNETVCSFSAPLFVEKAGLTAGNWNVSANILPNPPNPPTRTLRISAFSNDFTPLSGVGTLFNLRMLRTSSTSGASTPLTWLAEPNNFLFIDGDLNSHIPIQNNGLITITGGTPAPTATASPTPTATATAPSATTTPTPRPTSTATATVTATATATATLTATATATPTGTVTTPTPTVTATVSATATPTATAAGTATPTPTGTPVVTPTPTFEGNFVIGDLDAVVGNHVTFFSPQWARLNSLSGGPAPNSFKGFARHPNPNPAECGGTWTTSPGNSSHPPEHVPRLITAIASSSITQSGSTIMGDIPILVFIATDCHDDDNAPNSHEDGSRTGTVIAVICGTGPTPTPAGSPTPVVTPTPTLEGNFVIGNLNAVVGNHVTFFSRHWAEFNSLSGGPAPEDFRGFARHPDPNPAECGGTWTTSSDSHPPEHVPRLITAIAASSINESEMGSTTFMGDIPMLVVIAADDHDALNSDDGESRTGTVIAVICSTGPTPTPGASATPTPSPTGPPVVSPTPTFEGNFVVGDLNAVVGNHVTFFSRHWAEFNSLSGGPAPEGFKGFARHPDPNPAQCGGTWTSSSDSHPPEHVPTLITAIASSSITESDAGSATFMGDIPTLVVIVTDCHDDDDASNSGERDSMTGTVVAVICSPGPMTNGPLSNISTRLRVETGDNSLIGGFIVAGTETKRVLLRACGPSLPLSDRLADPILELHDASGQTIAANDNWRDAPNVQAIIDSTIPPSNDLESAILMNLPPGAYTATVRGVNNSTGLGLVEAYDLDRTVNSRLVNISTRGLVQTSDSVLIAGMIVQGQVPQRVIVRAIGPSLNLPGKLADPTLELRDGNGLLLQSNDNWRSDQEAEIIATTVPPTNDLESAIVATLPASGASYTVIVRGVAETTGVAVVEVYQLH